MSNYDLMNLSTKGLLELYKKELERVGATSLESVINEYGSSRSRVGKFA